MRLTSTTLRYVSAFIVAFLNASGIALYETILPDKEKGLIRTIALFILLISAGTPTVFLFLNRDCNGNCF